MSCVIGVACIQLNLETNWWHQRFAGGVGRGGGAEGLPPTMDQGRAYHHDLWWLGEGTQVN